jgi:hypothetical protein
MNSSRPQSPAALADLSSANSVDNFSSFEQREIAFDRAKLLPGSLDDAAVIRGVLLRAMKNSGMSRGCIADSMSELLGRQVTEKMLNAFTAESRDDRRWPAEFDRAFCKATGDKTLISCRAELAGMRVIDQHEIDLLELGRAFDQRTQADARIAELQTRLAGRRA